MDGSKLKLFIGTERPSTLTEEVQPFQGEPVPNPSEKGTTDVSVETVVKSEAIEQNDEECRESFEEPNSIAVDELIIKDEIEFGEYEFNYLENDSTGNDNVKPALETNVSEEIHKELVIKLEKLDYSPLAKRKSSNENDITEAGVGGRSCKHCGQKLKTWNALVKHLTSFHDETIDKSQFAQCPSCRAMFLTEAEMKEHVCLVRDRERAFKCELCRKTFTFLYQLEDHYSVHPEQQHIKCDQCPMGFFNERVLEKHKIKMHPVPKPASLVKPKKIRPFKSRFKNPLPRVECEHCGQTFALQYRLALHRVKEHGSTETPVANNPAPRTPLPRNFHCDQCDKSYRRQTLLVIHKAKVHGVGEAPPKEHRILKHTCQHCKKKFTVFGALVYHRKFVHGETIDKCVQCPSCRTKFLTEEEMKEHVCLKRNVRKKERSYKSKYKNPLPRVECEHCGQTFAFQYRLAVHRVKEHGSTETPVANTPVPSTTLPRNFHCDECDKSYHLKTNLDIHKAKVHGVGEAPPKAIRLVKHTCKHCKNQFTSWGALVYHRKCIHGESIDKSHFVQCPSCRLRFASQEEMVGHNCVRETVRETEERPFKCDLCAKAYFAKNHLEGHFSIHPEYHNFKCDQCPKGFFNERELKSHKKNMHKEKDAYVECLICNQLFKNQKYLKQHQEMHSDREYCCEHCDKKFKRRVNLNIHMHRKHAEHVSEESAREFTCPICGKILKGKDNLKAHMRYHNDRRFECSFPSCGKTFISNTRLKEHIQSHTKDYEFKCRFCAYGTVARNRILLHEQREHNHNRFADVGDS